MSDENKHGMTDAHGLKLDDVLETEAEPLVRGKRIGPYEVVDMIGRGGMGAVFLAERVDEHFQHRVAIKIVSGFARTPDTLARFRSERQILARLDHPYIAHLVDGGETESGDPYLVMEYVEGEPLMQACSDWNLDHRLELFLKICDAVQFAHQNLIVHRDLKPANILITQDGLPKLLDFGIAKIIDSEAGSHTVVETQLGQRLLTPDHAAPEQVLGQPITTATDVYCLGILLYELLVAKRPYTVEGKRPGELERIICEQIPAAPSSRLIEATRGGVDAAGLPLPADRLRRRLRGDLDNIVLKALRKEPERRYVSVAEFADDIRAYQRELPVSARPDTWTYRTSKFVRRNTAGVAAALVAMLILTVFTITTWVQGQRISRENQKVTQVSAFLIDAIRSADPNEARGKDITVMELLDSTSARVAAELSGQPDVQATLMSTMGVAYTNLGNLEAATRHLGTAVSLREQLRDSSVARVEGRNSLGEALKAQGRYQEAFETHQIALEEGKKYLGDEHPEISRAMFGIGLSLMEMTDYEQAEQWFHKALEMDKRQYDSSDPALAFSLTDFATIMWRLNKLELARDSFRAALEIRRAALGNDHPDTMEAVNNLAAIMVEVADHAGAEPLFREALEMNERLLGKEHPDIAINLNNLGYVLMMAGRFADAEPVFRRALAMDRKLLGQQHPDLAYSLNSLGTIMTNLGGYDEAEQLFVEALEVMARQEGYEHRLTGQVLANFALLLLRTGRDDDAYTRAFEAKMKIDAEYPADHWRRAFVASVLGDVLTHLGRFDEARPLLEGSIGPIVNSTGAESVFAREAQQRLARLEAAVIP